MANDKIYLPTKDQQDQLLSLIGKTNDTGGSASAGSTNAKLNSLINTIGTINSNVSTINTRASNIYTSTGSNSDSASQTGSSIQSKTKYIANTVATMNTTIGTINTNAANANTNAYNANVKADSITNTLSTINTNVNDVMNKKWFLNQFVPAILFNTTNLYAEAYGRRVAKMTSDIITTDGRIRMCCLTFFRPILKNINASAYGNYEALFTPWVNVKNNSVELGVGVVGESYVQHLQSNFNGCWFSIFYEWE